MKLDWDLTELTEFADRLSELPRFEKAMEKAAKEISKALLTWMKTYTPVDTYELINGWNGNKFVVTKKDNGFEVLIVNKTPYALYVNDGHKSYNQFGGPYKVKKRIQVRSPHQWQSGDPTYYVFGHFFVERGIIRLKKTEEVEKLIFEQLEKWWKGCLNG